MTHPLTLQDIAGISKQRLITMEIAGDMRSAYNLAIEHVYELWTEAQEMKEAHEIVTHFDNDLRLIFINNFLHSQQQEDNQ